MSLWQRFGNPSAPGTRFLHLTIPIPSFRRPISRSSAHGRKCKHSFTLLRSRAMRPPPPSLRASARRPRLARSKRMKANMRVLSIGELMRLTRVQLDRSLCPDHQRPAGHAGGLGRTPKLGDHPEQYPLRADAARSGAMTTAKPAYENRKVSA
jgi:hypothetical protein